MSYPRWINQEQNLREVAPGLYVGNEFAPGSERVRFGIIVDLCGSSASLPELYPPYASLLRIPLIDGEPIPTEVLEEVYDAVWSGQRRQLPVLIHCVMGLSRSASAAYGMLRTIYGLKHREALLRVVTPEGLADGYPLRETLRSVSRWADARQRDMA